MNLFTTKVEYAARIAQYEANFMQEPRYLIQVERSWWCDKFPSPEAIEILPNQQEGYAVYV